MTLKKSVFAICAVLLACPAQAQMPPQQNFRLPATIPPASNATVDNPVNVNAAQAISLNYIWFGNDQINQAVQMLRSGQVIQALEVLDTVTKLNMRLPEAHLLRGVAYMILKDYPRAEQSLNTVLAIDRGYLGAYVYLSQIALLKNNPQQVDVYLQAIKAVAMTEECAEYRFVKNSLRSAPAAAAQAQ
jgi:Tfp pilus assembly protein PilF